MAASAYESALKMAEALNPREQAQLIQVLLARSSAIDNARGASVLELDGLGADIWQQIDAQQYVDEERASWAG